jgi:hypothetical protein
MRPPVSLSRNVIAAVGVPRVDCYTSAKRRCCRVDALFCRDLCGRPNSCQRNRSLHYAFATGYGAPAGEFGYARVQREESARRTGAYRYRLSPPVSLLGRGSCHHRIDLPRGERHDRLVTSQRDCQQRTTLKLTTASARRLLPKNRPSKCHSSCQQREFEQTCHPGQPRLQQPAGLRGNVRRDWRPVHSLPVRVDVIPRGPDRGSRLTSSQRTISLEQAIKRRGQQLDSRTSFSQFFLRDSSAFCRVRDMRG